MDIISSDYIKLEEEDVIFERFICGDCGHSASSEDDLNQHRVSQHLLKAVFGFIEENVSPGGNLQCDECDYSSDNKLLLKNHVASVHKNVCRYSCSLCECKSYYQLKFSDDKLQLRQH